MSKGKRSLKVVSQSGYNYKETPAIILKGQWLKELGFDIGDFVSVSCENGRLVITPDAEKAAMKQAESEFMERELLALKKKLEVEKKQLHLHFVAERNEGYGA